MILCMKRSTISVARFYFGKFKNYLHFLRTGKRSLLGGVVKVHFVCLEGSMKACCRIVKYTWVPSSTKQKLTPATVARTPSRHHHRHFYTNCATFTVLRQDLTAKKKLSWITLNYAFTVVTNELSTSSVFQPWITKANARESYLA